MPEIIRADVTLFTYRLDKPMGGSGVSEADILWIELADRGGTIGNGFSYVIAGGGGPLHGIADALVERFLRRQVVSSPQATWRRIAKSFNRTGRGWNMLALAAIDVALWDLHAKRQGVPLGIAMGGEPRATPVYASSPFQPGMAPGAAAEAALAAYETGFRGAKPRVAAIPEDGPLIDAVAKATPKDRYFMLDVNEKGDLARARHLIKCADEYGALFVEEPLPTTDLGGYRRLAKEQGAMIATGEHLQSLTEFEPYIVGQMAAILQPDLAMIGGLTPCLSLAEAASLHGIALAPHFLPSLFIHVAAATPSLTWLEDFPLLEPMFENAPVMNEDGTMIIDPNKPGHALTLSEHAQYLIAAE